MISTDLSNKIKSKEKTNIVVGTVNKILTTGFIYLVNQDIIDKEIDLTEPEIKSISKLQWKQYVNKKVEETALKCLIKDNLDRSKTNHIEFESFKLSPYLTQNKNTSLSKTILCIVWNEWNYEVNLCVLRSFLNM